MRYVNLLLLCLLLVGCGDASKPDANGPPAPQPVPPQRPINDHLNAQTLAEARAGFQTKIVSKGPNAGPPDAPPEGVFELIRYPSPVGKLAAYVTPDPGDGKKHPAIVWITGGDNNSIGDVWSDAGRDNDQTARAFRDAGIVMMFPSQRGGNDNPGRREGFYGEADDILAATDYLASLPYVDPDRIYLGGHSTGGTMVMIVGALTDRYRAVFAFGPVDFADAYGGRFIYCNPNDEKEIDLRSPTLWIDSVKRPMYVIEGAQGSSNVDALREMARYNANKQVRFMPVPGHDHFSVLVPVNELLAKQIIADEVEVTEAMLRGLR